MTASLTFGAVVSLAFGSSVVGAIITQAATWVREQSIAKRETAYLALRIATVFERFAEETTNFVVAIDAFTDGEAEGVSTALPELRPLPDEKERWRDLRVDLTGKTLAFEETRRARQGSIDETWRESSPEDGITAARAYGITLAIDALALSRQLRKAYKLPTFDTVSSWPEFLTARFEELPDHWRVEARG